LSAHYLIASLLLSCLSTPWSSGWTSLGHRPTLRCCDWESPDCSGSDEERTELQPQQKCCFCYAPNEVAWWVWLDSSSDYCTRCCLPFYWLFLHHDWMWRTTLSCPSRALNFRF
jgi:hypothetical protein